MVNGNIEALFKDRKQQEAVFPITKIKAVSDDNGTGLNVLLDDMNTQIGEKAPSGYGLGENAGRYCADCHALGSGGLYYFDNNTANKPDGVTGTGSILVQSVVTTYGDYKRDIYVTLKSGANIAHCYYSSYAGHWQSWEWENPPMILGQEYRTTERYMDKPVYCKAVSIGALPAIGRTEIGFGSWGTTDIVRHNCKVRSNSVDYPFVQDLPFFSTGSYSDVVPQAFCFIVNHNTPYAIIQANTDLSSYSGVLTVWYTKN